MWYIIYRSKICLQGINKVETLDLKYVLQNKLHILI